MFEFLLTAAPTGVRPPDPVWDPTLPFCHFDPANDTACPFPLTRRRLSHANATLVANIRAIAPATIVTRPRLLLSAALAHYSAGVLHHDSVETGVYRGGTSILLLKVLEEHKWPAHHWAADSFVGLPRGSAEDYLCSNADRARTGQRTCGQPRGSRVGLTTHPFTGQYAASAEEFAVRVRRAGLGYSAKTGKLHVVRGWFNASLPPQGLRRIGFLRLDGDLYESTRDALRALYPLVVPGGAVYIDDYGSYGGCRVAVDEYRASEGITAPLHTVWESVGPRLGLRAAPQDWHGRTYDAVWWLVGHTPPRAGLRSPAARARVRSGRD